MTDDRKEWVTIKVPEATRDRARDDPRTYEQIIEAGLETEPFVGATDSDPDAIAERVSDRVPDYDDIKAATQAAIREEVDGEDDVSDE